MTKRALIFCISLMLIACTESDESEGFGVTGCSIAKQNEFVHKALQDRYFWYREIDDVVDYDDFASPRDTLDFLKFDPPDRFSYITSKAAFDSLFDNGQFLGYGFAFKLDDVNETMTIKFAHAGSPADQAGMQRGDRVLSINGNLIKDIITQIQSGDIFGANQQGAPINMRLQRPNGDQFDIHMEKTTVNINTVFYSDIFFEGFDRVGYLIFNSFLNTSTAELDIVFANFKARGVNKLILDLRYNGGGSVAVANTLASLIKGNNGPAELFSELRQNDKHRNDDARFFLSSMVNSLDLDEVSIITTQASCSASEMVINGLKPFIQVKQIGNTTCGKPVGMHGFEFCDNILLPITFKVFNANNEGEYFDGIPVDCAANDDLTFDLGNPNEPMLKAAMNQTLNMGCPVTKSPVSSSSTPSNHNDFRHIYHAW